MRHMILLAIGILLPLMSVERLPDSATRMSVVNTLRDTYKSIIQSTPERRIAFARLQIDNGADLSIPATEAAARLVLAAEIGQSHDRVDIVLQAGDALQIRFDASGVAELRKAWLAAMPSPAGKAASILLGQPDDPVANETLGTYFFQTVQDEAQAFAYWAKGQGRRKMIASQELSGSSSVASVTNLGDLWFEEGHASIAGAYRLSCYGRARACYNRVSGGIDGESKAYVSSRLAEIAKILPEEPKDWSKISPEQWSSFKGEVVRVPPTKDPYRIGAQIKEGKSFRVVPHPTDTWVIFAGGVSSSPTYRGMPPPNSVGTKFKSKPPEFGAMLVWADGRPVKPGDVVTGPAGLAYSVEMVGVDAENTIKLGGEGIRVKLVPVIDSAK